MITEEETRRDILAMLYELFDYMRSYDGFYDLPSENVLPAITDGMEFLFSGRAYPHEIMGGLIIAGCWPCASNDNGGHPSDRAEALALELLAMLDDSPEEDEES